MKLVLNVDYGGFGFGVAEEFEDYVREFCDDERRADPELVAFVESHPDECKGLAIKEIPDTATDWMIYDYDGYETAIYVLDGKIHRAKTIKK